MFSQFHSVCLVQAPNSPFRRTIVREERKRLKSDDGGGGDEFGWILFTAVALGNYSFGGCRVAVLYAVNVDAEHAVEVLGSEFEEWLHLGNACVCDPVKDTLVQ